MDGDIYNEVARELVPVSKLEGLEHWLDHMISGERVKMKATVSRETAVEVEVKLTKDQYQFQNESRYVQPSYGNKDHTCTEVPSLPLAPPPSHDQGKGLR